MNYRAERLCRLSPIELLKTLKCQITLSIDMLETGNFNVRTPTKDQEFSSNEILGYVGDFEIRVRPEE